jgi:hypothetical protein
MAGERSLTANTSNSYIKPPLTPTRIRRIKEYLPSPSPPPISPEKAPFDPKQIIKKLGLGRLRKMQALVRGFLVRRQVYPRELEQYLVAQSVM